MVFLTKVGVSRDPLARLFGAAPSADTTDRVASPSEGGYCVLAARFLGSAPSADTTDRVASPSEGGFWVRSRVSWVTPPAPIRQIGLPARLKAAALRSYSGLWLRLGGFCECTFEHSLTLRYHVRQRSNCWTNLGKPVGAHYSSRLVPQLTISLEVASFF